MICGRPQCGYEGERERRREGRGVTHACDAVTVKPAFFSASRMLTNAESGDPLRTEKTKGEKLVTVAKAGDASQVANLLQLGGLRSEYVDKALQEAVFAGSLSCGKALLSAKANPQAKSKVISMQRLHDLFPSQKFLHLCCTICSRTPCGVLHVCRTTIACCVWRRADAKRPSNSCASCWNARHLRLKTSIS
jgi:hypothetical protein